MVLSVLNVLDSKSMLEENEKKKISEDFFFALAILYKCMNLEGNNEDRFNKCTAWAG